MKTFLITNLSFFGDILLCGQLCSDIKKNYPDSKIIFITNKPFVDVAKYMSTVDDVLFFDKKGEHKGFWGLLKFAFQSGLRGKIDTAFTIYGNDRAMVLAWLLGAKQRVCGNKGVMNILSTHILRASGEHMSDANADMLKILTGKDSYCDEVEYVPSEGSQEYVSSVLKNSGYDKHELIGLCCLSKKVDKDWLPKDAAEFVNLVNESGKRVIVTGTPDARWFTDEMKKFGAGEFLDMTGATSIVELGALIQKCRAFVSVDTGAMHLSYAVKTPTLAMFFVDNFQKWAPKDLDRNSVVYNPGKINAKDAFDELNKLLEKTNKEVSV